MPWWLKWLTVALACLTALLEAGHLAHLFSSEVAVLVLAVATAIAAVLEAMTVAEPPKLGVYPTPGSPSEAAGPKPPAGKKS